MAETQRYFIKLAFNGKAYHGWQRQENALTVQQVLEEGLALIFGTKLALTGAGRTDTGVHATKFYAHFDLSVRLTDDELGKKVLKLNSYLPGDIFVFEIRPVHPHAHARFDAISRTYEYIITTRKDPFRQDAAWYVYGELDVAKMNEAAKLLNDYTDFTSFSKLHTQVKTNNCRIMEAHWEEDGSLLVFRIKADRFLRNMVRAIVGTLIDIGRGRIDTGDFKRIIEARNRSEASLSVPAHGLYLINIEYPD
ncbi:MAG: tRNA pseudouridine(38-40) synthase TruA [Bacteroidales bacterium]|nr:tRNA pseudouridine(38-40) synthase TruA [Bacteroidales bacterium]